MKKEIPTTKDIARLAQVSRGTVDRVLHDRGKVSDASKQKVMRVLEETGFKPNKLAKALQSNKVTILALLIPSPKQDEYWRLAVEGVREAISSMDLFKITIVEYYFDQQRKDDFLVKTQTLFNNKPDGVIFAPFLYQESINFLCKCKEKKLPCLTFNTHLKNNNHSFVGQDLQQSGVVAASLIHKTAKKAGTILIIHFDENISNAMHMQEKETGFSAYFKKLENATYKLQIVNITENNQEDLFSHFDQIFSTTPNISAVFVTNSKCYKVAEYIASNGINCVLIGYDLIRENRTHLSSGVIDFLIYQNPKRQAYLATQLLAEHLILHKQIPQETLLPLGVVIKENLASIE